MARVVRVRALQKRRALAAQAELLGQRNNLVTMLGRVDTLRAVYTAREGEADALLLKGMAHQHGRLQRPRDATVAQTTNIDRRLVDARANTLDAHMRVRAAVELEARAVKREMLEAERRADVNPLVARPLLGRVR